MIAARRLNVTDEDVASSLTDFHIETDEAWPTPTQQALTHRFREENCSKQTFWSRTLSLRVSPVIVFDEYTFRRMNCRRSYRLEFSNGILKTIQPQNIIVSVLHFRPYNSQTCLNILVCADAWDHWRVLKGLNVSESASTTGTAGLHLQLQPCFSPSRIRRCHRRDYFLTEATHAKMFPLIILKRANDRFNVGAVEDEAFMLNTKTLKSF